jgi:hypothetical protein
VTIEEMSLNNILKRNPPCALVDELAHTNVPGSRNRKRYQDALELLDAGINVIGAVNVQHLESLNDIVARATGVSVRETIPDGFLRQADQVVNLDLAVEDLQERLRAGKIYAADKIPWALEHFFKEQNLAHLRELALREVAESVERASARPALPGPSAGQAAPRTRVMVCLSSASPRAACSCARARGWQGRLSTDWFVVFVETPKETPSTSTRRRSGTDGQHRSRARARRGGRAPAFAEPRPRDPGFRAVARGRARRGRPIAPAVLEAAARPIGAAAAGARGGWAGRARRRHRRRRRRCVTVKTKLLLAQAPLAIVLILIGVLSNAVMARLGTESRLILADNYRSVLAAQRMKEALERVDSNALYMLAGHVARASEGIARNRAIFDRELGVQEGNITEAGERDITSRLQVAWTAYQKAIDTYRRLDTPAERRAQSTLKPSSRRSGSSSSAPTTS